MSDDYVKWLRSHVGPRKIFLPFVTVILRDGRGRVMLQRRTDFDFWGLPGGVLEMDEDIEGGARRELLEETGLKAGPLRLVGIYTDPRYDLLYPNGDQVQQFTFCLEGQMAGGEMRPDGVETTFQRFVGRENLAQYTLPVWYRDMLREAEIGGAPHFRAPDPSAPTEDQIASIRPFVGTARFSGVGAAVVLDDGDGRLLMLQHVGERHWRLPSGFCNLGENAAQTAVREVWEELRLQSEPLRILGVHATPQLNSTYANGDRVRNVGVVFQVRKIGGRMQLDSREIAEAAWMRPQEVLASVEPSRLTHYQLVLRHLQSGCFIG